MIIYRPHRGGLAEAMREARTFKDTNELKEWLVKHYRELYGCTMIEKEDIVLNINKPAHIDERIGWEDTRYVCLRRFGFEQFDTPQCFGMWATIFPGSDTAPTE